MFEIQDIGKAAAHARRKILPGFSEDNGAASGHILQPVISAAFYNCRGSGIADAEPLSGNAADIRFSACRPIKSHISDDNVLRSLKPAVGRGNNDNLSAGQSLSQVVIGISRQAERQSLRSKRAKRLSAASLAVYHKGIFLQTVPETRGNFRPEDRSQRPVRAGNLNGFLMVHTL